MIGPPRMVGTWTSEEVQCIWCFLPSVGNEITFVCEVMLRATTNRMGVSYQPYVLINLPLMLPTNGI